MFPLLKLHGTAAQRGDGLRQELLDALRREAPPARAPDLEPISIVDALAAVDITPAAPAPETGRPCDTTATETASPSHLPAT